MKGLARFAATLDETTFDPSAMGNGDPQMSHHPIAWSRRIGRGRAFHSAIGQCAERYSDAVYVQMLHQAIGWAAAVDGSGGRPTKC